MFTENYRISELIDHFDQVVDKSEIQRQGFLDKLDEVIGNQKQTNKKIIGFSFNNQKQKFEGGLN